MRHIDYWLSSRSAACVVCAALWVGCVWPAIADDDHERARELLREGRILPLSEVVAGVLAKVPGELMEVEFENEEGVHVYELKLLRPDGRVQEVEADAATGKILKIEDDD